MSEIISVIAQASSTSTSSWVDAPVTRAVSDSDAARLADLLSTQQVPATAPVVTPALTAPTAVPAAGKAAAMGDAILKSLDAAGRSYRTKMNEVDALMGDAMHASPGDLLRVQIGLMETSLQADLISKGLAKATQHIDQLTKLQ